MCSKRGEDSIVAYGDRRGRNSSMRFSPGTVCWLRKHGVGGKMGKVNCRGKRGLLATGLLWKKTTVCKHIKVPRKCNRYEMEHDTQVVEVLSFPHKLKQGLQLVYRLPVCWESDNPPPHTHNAHSLLFLSRMVPESMVRVVQVVHQLCADNWSSYFSALPHQIR